MHVRTLVVSLTGVKTCKKYCVGKPKYWGGKCGKSWQMHGRLPIIEGALPPKSTPMVSLFN